MQPHRNKLLTAALAISLVFACADASQARSKKAGTSGDLGLQLDADGTPIIMKGYRSAPRRSDAKSLDTKSSATDRTEPAQSGKQASRPVRARGSSTFIPPPVPSPTRSGGVTTGQAVQPYIPPPITTFGDRVNNAIQSYPLQRGIGNNPTDMQVYIRQNAN
jgi:hypothetical protein